MRFGLVDNATLTACQRLLGDIRVGNLYNIDGDLAAFENFIQSILLYDRLFFLDDYKSEYKKGRSNRFPFVQGIALAENLQNTILNHVRAAVADFTIRIEGGDITTEILKDFLDQINLHLVFAWHKSSSDFLLTTKILSGDEDFSIDTAGSLLAMIQTQKLLRERSAAPEIRPSTQLVSSAGEDVTNVRQHGGRKFDPSQVHRFIENLNWLCVRTAYYNIAGLSCGLDPILHPIRNSFSLSLAHHRMGLSADTRNYIVDQLKSDSVNILKEVKKTSDPSIVHCDLPFFSAWIATRTDGPKHFLDAALALRDHKKIVALRAKLSELDELETVGNIGKKVLQTNQMIAAIRQSAVDVLGEFGVKTANGIPLSPIIGIANAGLVAANQAIQIPDFKIGVPGTTSVRRLWNSRGYRGVFRSVLRDLSTVGRLGGLHKKLTAGVIRLRDATHAKIQVEEPKFRFAQPDWKIPM